MNDYSRIIDSYKISASAQEIVKVLEKSHEANLSIMWQNFSTHRTIFNILDFEMGKLGKKIRITYRASEEFINPKLPVYIKLPFRETVFKGKVSHENHHGLFLTLPARIHMRDYRRAARTHFEMDQRSVSLKQGEAGEAIPAILADICQMGMGLYIPKSKIPLFKKGQFFELHKLGDVFLHKCSLAQVTYVSSQSVPHHYYGHVYKVGMKMITLIPEDVLAQVST